MGFCGINKNEKNNKPQQRRKNEKQIKIVDLMALATAKPELFKDKKQLAFILDVKMKIINDMYKKFKKEVL
jgi:hypothetical protein